MSYDSLDWLTDALAEWDARSLRRTLISHVGAQGARLSVAGREYVNFSSNDYLDLAGDERLVRSAIEATREHGWGAGASPLITGRSTAHAQLEARIAEFEGTEAALVFNTGFAANAGTIPALVGEGDAIFSDALNHASLIDGCRLSRARIHVYRHADCADLELQLREAGSFRRRLIVTDSLFSMDGDIAPLPELCDLAEKYECMLMIDEAHATGVFGAKGRGLAEHFGVEERVPIRVGTLSKALGASGGFVAGSQQLIDWLANRARSYVFSTAPPAAACAAAMQAIEIVGNEPARRERLLSAASDLRGRLCHAGVDIGNSASQIITIILGDERRTLAMAEKLRSQGFFVPAIRPPTVPAGASRLRISLTAGHSEAMIESFVRAVAEHARG